MTVQIDTTAENNGLRLVNQGTHPSAPSVNHTLLYIMTGTNSGLYIQNSNGQRIGPFITGTSVIGGTQDYYKWYESGSLISVSGTTSEMTLYSGSFNGNLLGANGLMVIDSLIDLNHGVVGNAVLKLYYGSQFISSPNLGEGSVASSKPGRVSFRMGNLGNTGLQFVNLQIQLVDGTIFYFRSSTESLSVDSTVAQRLQLTVQWNTADSGLSYNQKHLNIGYYP